jgi:hypothetical protein
MVDDGRKVVAGGHCVSIGCGYGNEGCCTGTVDVSIRSSASLSKTYCDQSWDLDEDPFRSRSESRNRCLTKQYATAHGNLPPSPQIEDVEVKMRLVLMAALGLCPWTLGFELMAHRGCVLLDRSCTLS